MYDYSIISTLADRNEDPDPDWQPMLRGLQPVASRMALMTLR